MCVTTHYLAAKKKGKSEKAETVERIVFELSEIMSCQLLEDMETFMRTIKDLTDDIDYAKPDGLFELGDVENNHEEKVDLVEHDNTGRSTPNDPGQTFNLDIPVSDEVGSDKQLYKCEKCEASYKSKVGLYYHISSKHKGISYSCKYCEYKATQQSSLKKHENSIHEGVKHSCNQCDYQATQTYSVKYHMEIVHKGFKYSCDQCDYQATQQGNLKIHKKSVHDEVKYSCDKCDHQSTQQSNLKTHKKSVHGGVKYFCDKCKYQTTWKNALNRHKYTKHRLNKMSY